MQQQAKLQREIQLKNEAMEQIDKNIEQKNEKEKTRHFDMVNKFKNKVGSSQNKWQDQNDSSRGDCGDGFLNIMDVVQLVNLVLAW